MALERPQIDSVGPARKLAPGGQNTAERKITGEGGMEKERCALAGALTWDETSGRAVLLYP